MTRLKISDEVTLCIGQGDFLIWDEVIGYLTER